MPNQRLNKIIEAIDSYTSEESFKKLLELVVKVLTQTKENILKEITAMRESFNGMMSEIKSKETEMSAKQMKMMSYCEAEMKKMYSEHEEMIKEMDEKMANIHSGKDADEEMMMNKMLLKMPKPLEADDAYSIRNKLEDLEGKERLKIDAIADLQEKLDEIKQIKTQRTIFGGGGFSKIAMDSHIIDDETPSGTINGVNADFTILAVPNPTGSLKVFLNGARQRITTDYTLSGKTITFLTAPPTGSILLIDYRS